MSFWEDASPAVKGAVVVGGIGILYFLIAMVAGLPPYGGDAETRGERGFSAADAVAGDDSAEEE